ncbi:MAG: PDZ domain-containing protein [Ferruginibacter sp.]
MKKIISLGIISWFFALCSQKVAAQETPKAPEQKNETQEIIIRKKGDKDKVITLQFSDDKVMINGKPLVEFNDDEISVNNRKIVISGKKLERDLDDMMKELDVQLRNMDIEVNGVNGDFEWNGEDFESGFPGASAGRSGNFLGVTYENDKDGAKISSVTKNSPAEKAGLQKDDIITKVGDIKIDADENSLSSAIEKQKAGEEVKINFLRNGKKKDLKVKLAKRTMATARSFSRTAPGGRTKVITIPEKPAFGLAQQQYQFDLKQGRLEEMRHNMDNNRSIFVTGFRRKKLGLKIQDLEEGSGVKVLEVEDSSAAFTAGLKKDDIITEINGKKVNNTDEAREQLRSSEEKTSYPVKATRNGAEMNFTVKIPRKLKTAEL